MEEADVVPGDDGVAGGRGDPPGDRTAGTSPLARLMAKAAALALVGAIIGFVLDGPLPAAGAAAGCLVAGIYAGGYLQSHLRDRERALDRRVAFGAALRLSMVAVGGALAWLAGKLVLIAFIASFGLAFALLIVSEIPHVTRRLRARGLIGGGEAS